MVNVADNLVTRGYKSHFPAVRVWSKIVKKTHLHVNHQRTKTGNSGYKMLLSLIA